MATATDFGAAGASGGGGAIQPMELGLTVQQTAPIDIKQFLESTLVRNSRNIVTLQPRHTHTHDTRLKMLWRVLFTAA